MRFFLTLIVAALAACGGPAEEPAATEEMHTAADELQRSIEKNLQEANALEEQMQQSVDALDAAIDEAAGEN
ncbi:MAG: hypothetical protein OEW64_08095 [Gammaproteobacteria bacterium]|nr:hypothetical protein [Gammaproteobacteria bacterium]MDH5304045.1 hypothetical protein [Gammaproteobacteria bacterium]MDH5321690.1 hypothetical protein [Gammaproteobacteria bacterium]